MAQGELYPGKRRRRVFLPILMYVLTWISATWVGSLYAGGSFLSGLWFSVPLLTILTCHEMGHFLQARRYRVESSLPWFIPVPFPPFGTMGAVICLDRRIPNIRALFDIGISGPLAGLIPTLVFMVIGIACSHVEQIEPSPGMLIFGEPLLFRWVSSLFFERSDPSFDLVLHPIGMAAWTGLFITSLNLFPIGQLDGGHVFYSLLKRRSRPAARILFGGTAAAVILTGSWQWSVMLLLVAVIGIYHPPTADDAMPLGRGRAILGWLTLAFLLIGFTPNPISEPEIPKQERKPFYSIEETMPGPAESFVCRR
ncbi:MAG: site-2 protease family protein [Thermoguttaceae bacterium]|nr:site-2 protease family protein [Thermoguttaceae bacterium]